MKSIIFFLLGIFFHWLLTNYAINKSIKRKVLFWNKHAYFLKDLGNYNLSNMNSIVKKVDSIENDRIE